jgi:hypothetical protein
LQRTPETTAQLRRRIVGDLDQIVLLCLRRDPRHRYTSASALAEDLRRFLDGRSVLARREPMIERTLRFLKRNRAAVAICMLIVLSLCTGIWQTVAAQLRARMADAREAEMKHVLDILDQRNTTKLGPGSMQVEDVRRLRGALNQDLGKAWSLRPKMTPERKTLLERSTRYLDSVRPYAAENTTLALEVAGAYQEVGTLYEPVYRDCALLAYRNAAQFLEQASGGDPNHGTNHVQWAFLVGRIASLGGTIPVYVSPPPMSAPKPDQKKDGVMEALPRTPIRGAASPPPPPPILILPVDSAAYEFLNRRLDLATNRVEVADKYFDEISANLKSSGEAIHPLIAENHARMRNALDSARNALKKRDLDMARTNINTAIECARRVMNELGH